VSELPGGVPPGVSEPWASGVIVGRGGKDKEIGQMRWRAAGLLSGIGRGVLFGTRVSGVAELGHYDGGGCSKKRRCRRRIPPSRAARYVPMRAILMKLKRGAFNATWFLAALVAIGAETVKLADL